jgi:hypothetical protein
MYFTSFYGGVFCMWGPLQFGLLAKERFNNFPNHSSLRRKKKKSAAVNMVFSKKEGN